MIKITKNSRRRYALYIGLALVLLACWWIGWRDYDPTLAQEVVRENIRASIRGLIQISIQYIVPIAILVFFTSEFLTVFHWGRIKTRPETNSDCFRSAQA